MTENDPRDTDTESASDKAEGTEHHRTSDDHGQDIDEGSKHRQLDEIRETPDKKYLTSDQGVRVDDTDNSLTAGARGPTLMEDFHFREK